MRQALDRKRLLKLAATCTLTLCALLLALTAAGCSEEQQGTSTAASQPQGTTPAATTGAAPVSATTVATTGSVNQADCPPDDDSPAPPNALPDPVVVSYSVDKAVYNYGDWVKFSAQVQGEAASVRVVWGGAGGDISTQHSISVMTEQSTNGGVTTWITAGGAPHGFAAGDPPGECFYMLEIVTTDNRLIRVTDNAHTFVVNG